MKPGLTATFVRRFVGGPEIRADSLQAEAGPGVTVLFGASGSGKTTILRCLAGLDSPDEGKIAFDGETWFDSSRRFSLPSQHRQIGFVPQSHTLFPHLTVEANVAYGLNQLAVAERREKTKATLHWLGLDGLEKRLPHELSGGQQQRVALARAVARSPQLLLLDEPLSALDASTRQRLRGELRQWLDELAIPTLLVTHDRTEALALGRQIVVLNHGRTEQAGPVHEVFNRPANLAVAQIVGVESVLPGLIIDRRDGMVTVEVAKTQLRALDIDLPPQGRKVHVCIRAEDVVLTLASENSGSARNRIPAVVEAIRTETPLVRLELDCGFPLKALITRQALEELNLQPGSRLVAWVKAPHVHLIAA